MSETTDQSTLPRDSNADQSLSTPHYAVVEPKSVAWYKRPTTWIITLLVLVIMALTASLLIALGDRPRWDDDEWYSSHSMNQQVDPEPNRNNATLDNDMDDLEKATSSRDGSGGVLMQVGGTGSAGDALGADTFMVTPSLLYEARGEDGAARKTFTCADVLVQNYSPRDAYLDSSQWQLRTPKGEALQPAVYAVDDDIFDEEIDANDTETGVMCFATRLNNGDYELRFSPREGSQMQPSSWALRK